MNYLLHSSCEKHTRKAKNTMVNWEQEREIRYLSIKEVAEAIKVPPAVLSFFEKGQLRLSEDLLKLLIDYYEQKPKYTLSLTGVDFERLERMAHNLHEILEVSKETLAEWRNAAPFTYSNHEIYFKRLIPLLNNFPKQYGRIKIEYIPEKHKQQLDYIIEGIEKGILEFPDVLMLLKRIK